MGEATLLLPSAVARPRAHRGRGDRHRAPRRARARSHPAAPSEAGPRLLLEARDPRGLPRRARALAPRRGGLRGEAAHLSHAHALGGHARRGAHQALSVPRPLRLLSQRRAHAQELSRERARLPARPGQSLRSVSADLEPARGLPRDGPLHRQGGADRPGRDLVLLSRGLSGLVPDALLRGAERLRRGARPARRGGGARAGLRRARARRAGLRRDRGRPLAPRGERRARARPGARRVERPRPRRSARTRRPARAAWGSAWRRVRTT